MEKNASKLYAYSFTIIRKHNRASYRASTEQDTEHVNFDDKVDAILLLGVILGVNLGNDLGNDLGNGLTTY